MKLPKARKRGDSYMIELMFEKKRYSCTRDTAKECETWAANKIIELKAAKAAPEIKTTPPFRALINLFFERVGCKTKSAKVYASKIKSIDNILGELVDRQIHEITPQDLTNWRNKRLLEVSKGTVLKEISMFSSIMSYAQKELFLLDSNPFFNISKPPTPEARNRRISQNEINIVKKEFRYEEIAQPETTQQYVAWAFLFAIETAMRRGEILAMKKQDIFPGHIHILKSKNKRLFEESGLVIVDIDDAIKNGFTTLTRELEKVYEEEHK